MRFGEVIEIWKKEPDRKFTRTGWGFKNTYVYFQAEHRIKEEDWRGPKPSYLKDGYVRVASHFIAIMEDGLLVTDWCPWTDDMFAEDWIEVIE